MLMMIEIKRKSEYLQRYQVFIYTKSTNRTKPLKCLWLHILWICSTQPRHPPVSLANLVITQTIRSFPKYSRSICVMAKKSLGFLLYCGVIEKLFLCALTFLLAGIFLSLRGRGGETERIVLLSPAPCNLVIRWQLGILGHLRDLPLCILFLEYCVEKRKNKSSSLNDWRRVMHDGKIEEWNH